MQLKFDKWQDSELGSGNYGYVRFPGQSGGNDLRYDIGFGYEGDFPFAQTLINPEEDEYLTYLDTEQGHTTGPLLDAIEFRTAIMEVDEDGKVICDLLDHVATNNAFTGIYSDSAKIYEKNCPLVIFIPIVSTPKPDNPNKGMVTVIKYGSFLLDPNVDDKTKEVWSYFIEFLSEEELMTILGNYSSGTKGAIIRLLPV